MSDPEPKWVAAEINARGGWVGSVNISYVNDGGFLYTAFRDGSAVPQAGILLNFTWRKKENHL